MYAALEREHFNFLHNPGSVSQISRLQSDGLIALVVSD